MTDMPDGQPVPWHAVRAEPPPGAESLSPETEPLVSGAESPLLGVDPPSPETEPLSPGAEPLSLDAELLSSGAEPSLDTVSPERLLPAHRRSRPRGRPHRATVAVLATVLALVLVGGSALTWHLLRVNAAWQEHTQQWQGLADGTATQLAQSNADLDATRADLAAAQQQLASVQDQLTTAQSRITQLANEKAQLGDQSAVQQQLADYQSRVSQAAGQVATSLASCISGQQKLITYMENASMYDPSSLASFRSQVEQYCGQASDANAKLQKELSQ